jgi:fructokinase
VPYDITGAGDAFAAGFLAAWIRGHPLRACAELGNRIAREALAVPGTRLDSRRLARLRPKQRLRR